MAIIGPADLPAVLKANSTPMKSYVLAQLGHPVSAVELTEDQFEIALRVTGDFICGYFPREQRLSWFQTTPLQNTYPMPRDAYWIQEVAWDPVTTNINDIFSLDVNLLNNGGLISPDQMLLDLHLLASYRKFSRKILGTEGHWEVLGEVAGDSSQQLIRLYPTPKGSYPVLVLYYPVVTHFRSPQAKKLAYDMLLAEAKCMLGAARRKITGIPTPDGGSISYDGEALVQEGLKEKEEIIQKALYLGEPDRIFAWAMIPFIAATLTLLGSLIA